MRSQRLDQLVHVSLDGDESRLDYLSVHMHLMVNLDQLVRVSLETWL
jgi:hypothetical protein